MKHTTLLIATILLISVFFSACKNGGEKSTTSSSQTAPSKSFSLNYQDATKPANRLFPDKLRYLPNVIAAAHFPNPCYATLEDSMYIWKHNITVKTDEDLQIVEYGSFVYTENGWYLRVTFTPSDFEKSYNCIGGLLKKGIVYKDNGSWRRDNKLTAGDAMWYFIAKDKNGNLVKGTAPIETEARLVSSSIKNTLVASQAIPKDGNTNLMKDNTPSKMKPTFKLPTTKNAIIQSEAINWTGYGEIGGYSLTGKIKIKDASIELQSDSIKKAIIVLDMLSLSHDNKDLESHLKGEDFFEVVKYPSANFVTESIKYLNATSAIAKGKLTIKGITKQVDIPLQITANETSKIIKGKFVIDRTQFGIKYNSKSFFGDLEDQAIKNNFDLVFELEIK
jgi:polyisoprenoid-binding protein YceI